jgi:RNA polymerase sigma-70 factor (ECF subfamily)
MTRPGLQSESDLLRLAAAGDEEAFRILYQRFQGPVYRFALHMGGAAVAEDITQEVFMTLIEKRSRFDASRGSLRAYLVGAARHLLLRRFERDQRLVPFPDAGSPNGASASGPDNHWLPSVPPPDPVRSENIRRVRQAVRSLPRDYREAVVLCELEEFSYEEASEILDCPVGTLRSRLHRARALLAEKLREFEQPAEKNALRSTS